MSVLLAKPWTEKIDPTGWWMSEKLDGVRAIWLPHRLTGDSRGQFLSRNLKLFYAPQWFKDLMPDVTLDGELFVGRGKFDKTVSVVRAHDDRGWDKVSFRAFDLYPSDMEGHTYYDQITFEARMVKLKKIVRKANAPKVLKLVAQEQCRSVSHMFHFADRIYNAGGEGVMLRKPGSLYEKKRSGTLLKVKQFEDCEAKVLGVVPGKGKHLGRMGALDVSFRDALSGRTIKFQVGTGFSDAEREQEWKKGTFITVRYQELTKDCVPRFPVYVSMRDYE